jgi:quercetin dioxygenase-like cupin family protein
MSDDTHDAGQHRRPHTQAMAGPFLELDLTRELAQLNDEPDWQNGHNARTLVKYEDFRIVLVGLKAHARIPEHKAGGRVSIHTIAGHLQVRAQDRTFSLPAGRVLVLDQAVPHDVEALQESALLLTIAWPGRPIAVAAPGGA